MKANLLITALIALALSSTAQAKLQTIQTYTPPAGVDAGCGKGKPVYRLQPSGSKVCTLPKTGGAK